MSTRPAAFCAIVRNCRSLLAEQSFSFTKPIYGTRSISDWKCLPRAFPGARPRGRPRAHPGALPRRFRGAFPSKRHYGGRNGAGTNFRTRKPEASIAPLCARETAQTGSGGGLRAELAAGRGLYPHIWREKRLFFLGESAADPHISQERKSLKESSSKAVNFFENQAKKGFDRCEPRPYKPPPSTGRGAEALTTRWERKKGLANLSLLWPSRRSIKERRPATTSKWKWRKGRPSGRIRPSFRGV